MGWVKRKFLGQGAFGQVFLAQSSELLSSCQSPDSVPFVAIKTVLVGEASTLRREKEIYDGVGASKEILKCLGSDRVIENGREYYYLVLEYASGGTLQKLLEGRRISELEASCYAKMLLKGLSHVHKNGFVHCDLKPDNVLVVPSKNPLVNGSLKLADFGRGKRRGEMSSKPLRGTLPYSSPESVAYGEHEAPTDIWSFGCIMFRMFFGIGMWDGYRNVDQRVLLNMIAGYDERMLIFPGPLSISAQDFLMTCLTKNFKLRWTADQLLKHPFVTHTHNWKRGRWP